MHVRARREDEPEDRGIDREEEQRIDQRPEVPEDAAALTRGKFPARQRRDERSVAP